MENKMDIIIEWQKQRLKKIAKQIKQMKATRKQVPNGYVHNLDAFRYAYRHMHIAYCMIRGKVYEQIENKVHEGNEPSETYINFWIEHEMLEREEKEEYIRKGGFPRFYHNVVEKFLIEDLAKGVSDEQDVHSSSQGPS